VWPGYDWFARPVSSKVLEDCLGFRFDGDVSWLGLSGDEFLFIEDRWWLRWQGSCSSWVFDRRGSWLRRLAREGKVTKPRRVMNDDDWQEVKVTRMVDGREVSASSGDVPVVTSKLLDQSVLEKQGFNAAYALAMRQVLPEAIRLQHNVINHALLPEATDREKDRALGVTKDMFDRIGGKAVSRTHMITENQAPQGFDPKSLASMSLDDITDAEVIEDDTSA